MKNHTLVNIPDPHYKGSRVVGYRIEEGSEAYGECGLSEPLDWFNKKLSGGIKNHDGQKLVVQFILDTDKELSDYSRKILEDLIS